MFPKYGELFFSVDVGPVHVIVLDDAWVVSSSGDVDFKGIFKSWLEADLAAADKNRAKVPWILAMPHHPECSSSLRGNDQDVLRGRELFGPIWDRCHVDVVLAGHDHNDEPLAAPVREPHRVTGLARARKTRPQEARAHTGALRGVATGRVLQ